MSTTTPSLLGERISYAIRYEQLDAVIKELDIAGATPDLLQTSDYSLHLLLAVPLLAQGRIAQFRLATFCLLLAAGCDFERRGADGISLDWELSELAGDLKTWVEEELQEAKLYRKEGRPYELSPDVKTWIQKELEKTSLQRKQDVDQKETERRLIFIELEKEMWEIEESMKPPPPKRPRIEEPEEELMDYEEVMGEAPVSTPAPLKAVIPAESDTPMPVISSPKPLPPPSSAPPPQPPAPLAESETTKPSSPPQAPNDSSVNRLPPRSSEVSKPIATPSAAKSSPPQEIESSLSSSDSDLPKSASPKPVSPVLTTSLPKPAIKPLTADHPPSVPASTPATSLVPTLPISQPHSLPAPLPSTAPSAPVPFISPAAALAPKFVTAKPVPGQVGWSINRLPPKSRPSNSVTPSASPAPTTSSQNTTSSCLSGGSPPPPVTTSTSPTKDQSATTSQPLAPNPAAPLTVERKGSPREARSASVLSAVTSTSSGSTVPSQPGKPKPRRSRLPANLVKAQVSKMNGTNGTNGTNGLGGESESKERSGMDSKVPSSTTSVSSDAADSAAHGGEGEIATTSQEAPSNEPPAPVSTYQTASRDRLPPRRIAQSSPEAHLLTFRNLPDFVTPPIMQHFLTHGPDSFDSITSDREAQHLDSLLELDSIKPPTAQPDASIPSCSEVKVYDHVEGNRKYKRAAVTYRGMEEVERIRILFSGKKLVKASPGEGIEIDLVKAAQGEGVDVISLSNVEKGQEVVEAKKVEGWSPAKFLPPTISPTTTFPPPSRSRLPPSNGSKRASPSKSDSTSSPEITINKLPAFVTVEIWTHFLTYGPRSFDSVRNRFDLDQLNRLLLIGAVEIPERNQEEEMPPKPLKVEIMEFDYGGQERKGLKRGIATYRNGEEARKAKELFRGKKILPHFESANISNRTPSVSPRKQSTLPLAPPPPPSSTPSFDPLPQVAPSFTITFTKLPQLITTSLFSYFLRRGPKVFDKVEILKLRGVQEAIDNNKPHPLLPAESSRETCPPVPQDVRIVSFDADSSGGQVTYATKEDATRAYRLFNGRKIFSCLAGGGIGAVKNW